MNVFDRSPYAAPTDRDDARDDCAGQLSRLLNLSMQFEVAITTMGEALAAAGLLDAGAYLDDAFQSHTGDTDGYLKLAKNALEEEA